MASPVTTYFEPGTWNAECSICARKMKANQMVKNWQGFYRCPDCNEPRNAQDFVKGVVDDVTVPWSQPPTSTYITFCSFNGQSAFPGFATPGCSVPGRTVILLPEVD